jgi:hypothetical protein
MLPPDMREKLAGANFRPLMETLEEHGEGAIDMVRAMLSCVTSAYQGAFAPQVIRGFERRDKGLDICLQSNEISRRDLSKLTGLLQCRLAWYGFQSVKVGQLRELSEHTLLVELLHARGTLLCQIEIDRRSGTIRRLASHALARLLASLRQATTEHGSSVAELMANR